MGDTLYGLIDGRTDGYCVVRVKRFDPAAPNRKSLCRAWIPTHSLLTGLPKGARVCGKCQARLAKMESR
jgi:hypothetical protein